MNRILAARDAQRRAAVRGGGLGAIEIPSWCWTQAQFKTCADKQKDGCTYDCTNDTDNPAADCIPKCTAAWTDIQCTPACLKVQPNDPNGIFGVPLKTIAIGAGVAGLAGLAIYLIR